MAAFDTKIQSDESLVDYAKTLDCIHCGLCLQTCPTYLLTGVETSSPRGRIHLMRAVGEGRIEPDAAYAEELDFCLLCRHCESVCPAGVRFGEMMEHARSSTNARRPPRTLARLARHLGFRVLLPNRLLLRLVGSALRFAQMTRLDRVLARFGGVRGRGIAELPRIPPLSARRLLPPVISALGDETERACVLEGCAQPEFFARVNRATIDSLIALGVSCEVPRDVVCCGSLHAHNGDLDGARALARVMIEGFAQNRAIVVNSAGCGAHMRELDQLFDESDPWHARARDFAARVVDFAEFVAPRLAELDTRELDLAGAVPVPITWDDPCHLCHGQGVRREPRSILESIAGDALVPLPDSESCCGSAGIYSILRPADSAAVFERKLEAFRTSGARTVVTANPGCQLQWETGLRRAGEDARVVHLAELVAHALRRLRRNQPREEIQSSATRDRPISSS